MISGPLSRTVREWRPLVLVALLLTVLAVAVVAAHAMFATAAPPLAPLLQHARQIACAGVAAPCM